jgi:hypothetical protein
MGGEFHALSAPPLGEEHQYPSNRMGGPQRQSGCLEKRKISCLYQNLKPFIQPMA